MEIVLKEIGGKISETAKESIGLNDPIMTMNPPRMPKKTWVN